MPKRARVINVNDLDLHRTLVRDMFRWITFPWAKGVRVNPPRYAWAPDFPNWKRG